MPCYPYHSLLFRTVAEPNSTRYEVAPSWFLLHCRKILRRQVVSLPKTLSRIWKVDLGSCAKKRNISFPFRAFFRSTGLSTPALTHIYSFCLNSISIAAGNCRCVPDLHDVVMGPRLSFRGVYSIYISPAPSHLAFILWCLVLFPLLVLACIATLPRNSCIFSSDNRLCRAFSASSRTPSPLRFYMGKPKKCHLRRGFLVVKLRAGDSGRKSLASYRTFC